MVSAGCRRYWHPAPGAVTKHDFGCEKALSCTGGSTPVVWRAE
ncbi:hypothetical protein SAMN04487818_101500 [Actinokineospora terrae]|uniref:Uncharacterized protein n=1 Tax=Actinokineospora terrae TaxID=155974 RepID=A0A1H9L7X4_9PSEU|nr:hypothetical protein SAMN04487818_101500 [Actinokineospora terrae]